MGDVLQPVRDLKAALRQAQAKADFAEAAKSEMQAAIDKWSAENRDLKHKLWEAKLSLRE